MRKMTKRFGLLLASVAMVGTVAGCGSNAASVAAQSPTTQINFYSGGDTNVQNLWQKTLIPEFEQKNPNIKVHLVFLEHGNGNDAIFQKIDAAKKSGQKSVDVDVWESGSDSIAQGEKDGLWAKLDQSNVPNLSMVDRRYLTLTHQLAVPYRASSVVLAYNSDKVKNPPQTATELYDWIRTHKGEFAYNDPSTGGSGDSFIVTALYNFMDPADMMKPYDPSIEKKWDKGFALLKQLAPDMYQNGVYPKGNQGTLDLLAKGDIDMCPAWSDMGLQEKAKGLLPSNIQFTQIDPAFTGGPAFLLVPQMAAHKSAAMTFVNFVLSKEAQKQVVDTMYGYPGIQWSYMPKDVYNRFKSVAKNYRFFIGGQYGNDMHKQWQEKVVQ